MLIELDERRGRANKFYKVALGFFFRQMVYIIMHTVSMSAQLGNWSGTSAFPSLHVTDS
jgi:hypothetical protein